jgi:hypothetical protein
VSIWYGSLHLADLFVTVPNVSFGEVFMERTRVFRIGGIVSGVVLIAFGIAVIVLALQGNNTVTTSLKQQQITGTPDMTPANITAEVNKAGLKNVPIPSCDVAGKAITSGSDARCFAQYMNVHALLATGGYVYAQMGIYTAKPGTPKSQLEPGGGTNNVAYAQTDPKTGQPVQNQARNIWVTETALSTALNVSYMATQLSLFSVVVGVALILSGIGFIILALTALRRTGDAETIEPLSSAA